MAEFPIDPIELELEVTETLLLDDEELFSARMRQLRAIGVRVAIDDFGTRYTGFNVLKNLPLNSMKIDQCFIRGIDRSPGYAHALRNHHRHGTAVEATHGCGRIEELGELDCAASRSAARLARVIFFSARFPRSIHRIHARVASKRKREFGFKDHPVYSRTIRSSARWAKSIRWRSRLLVYNPDERKRVCPALSGARE